jgi:hypothetical protein
VRHFAAFAVGWMNVAVGVGPEGAVVVEENTGVPVSHVMDPPQAAPGSGVSSHVQEAYGK